jgi:hypothetical protein
MKDKKLRRKILGKIGEALKNEMSCLRIYEGKSIGKLRMDIELKQIRGLI